MILQTSFWYIDLLLKTHVLLLLMLKTVVLLDIFVETEQLFFLKRTAFVWNRNLLWHVLFKALLLNKSINLWTFLQNWDFALTQNGNSVTILVFPCGSFIMLCVWNTWPVIGAQHNSRKCVWHERSVLHSCCSWADQTSALVEVTWALPEPERRILYESFHHSLYPQTGTSCVISRLPGQTATASY